MYQCNYCRGTDIVCEAKVKLNNDVDEKGYYSISTIKATKFSLQ